MPPFSVMIYGLTFVLMILTWPKDLFSVLQFSLHHKKSGQSGSGLVGRTSEGMRPHTVTKLSLQKLGCSDWWVI